MESPSVWLQKNFKEAGFPIVVLRELAVPSILGTFAGDRSCGCRDTPPQIQLRVSIMRDPVPSPNKLPNRGLSCFAESLKDAPVLSESEIRRILSELLIDPSDDDVQAVLHYDPQNYTRNFVLNTKTVQVLLLCWAPGQASKIHDHGQSNCGLRVLSGRATETVYQGTVDACVPSEQTPLEPGAIRVNPGTYIHRIENDNAEPLITLHVYSPPLIAIQK